MHGTTSSVGLQDRASRLAAARRRSPEALAWLELLELALDAAESEPWTALEPRLPPARPADAPVLDDSFVTVAARPAKRLVKALVRCHVRSVLATAAADAALGAATSEEAAVAASLRSLRGRRLDALAVIEAAARQDAAAVSAVAEAAGADAGGFRVVADLAALPLLRGCARAVASRMPTDWGEGYCPACGAWAALVELRGIERTRRLRCGRCATDWALPVLRCPYCGEADHRKLTGLAPEGQDQRLRVDGCESCGGYTKTVTTLAPLPAWAIPLEDLSTLELDLAAAERGWARPERPGYAIRMRVVDAGGGLSSLMGGWA